MSAENFLELQTELIWAFLPFAQWWLILLLVGGVGLAVLIFFLEFVGNWLDAR